MTSGKGHVPKLCGVSSGIPRPPPCTQNVQVLGCLIVRGPGTSPTAGKRPGEGVHGNGLNFVTSVLVSCTQRRLSHGERFPTREVKGKHSVHPNNYRQTPGHMEPCAHSPGFPRLPAKSPPSSADSASWGYRSPRKSTLGNTRELSLRAYAGRAEIGLQSAVWRMRR